MTTENEASRLSSTDRLLLAQPQPALRALAIRPADAFDLVDHDEVGVETGKSGEFSAAISHANVVLERAGNSSAEAPQPPYPPPPTQPRPTKF